MAFQALFEKACIDYDSGKSPTLAITVNDGAPEPLPFEAPTAGESGSRQRQDLQLRRIFQRTESVCRMHPAGVPPTDATLEDARASLEVVFAEIESARAQRPIAVGAKA